MQTFNTFLKINLTSLKNFSFTLRMKKALIMAHAIKCSQRREHKGSVIIALFNASLFIFFKRKNR